MAELLAHDVQNKLPFHQGFPHVLSMQRGSWVVTIRNCSNTSALALAAVGGQMWRASMDGSVGTRDSGLVYVLMTPVLMSAWVVMQGSHQLAALFNHVDWRTRELLDCATLALRACWARSTFELERMSLLQLVLGIPPDSSEEHFRQAAAGPSSVTVQRLRQRAILLPSQPAASSVMLVRRQLNLHAFTQVLEAWLLDPEKPFAFYGPGNFKVDSWLFFHEPDKQLPLVLFVSSKQRLGRETVNAAKIMEEMKKVCAG